MLPRNAYFIGIAFFGMINGLFNTAIFTFVFFHVLLLAPTILFGSAALTFMFSSLFGATVSIVAAGIPAALYERARGLTESDDISLTIWLAGTALIALPAMGQFFAVGL
jgi:hypothetical protein